MNWNKNCHCKGGKCSCKTKETLKQEQNEKIARKDTKLKEHEAPKEFGQFHGKIWYPK